MKSPKLIHSLATGILFLWLMLLLFSCRPDPHYPLQPVIEFKSYVRFADGTADYTIKFTDGDGDIRTSPEQTQNNIFFYYYVKDQSGNFVLYDYTPQDTIPAQPTGYTTPVIDASYGRNGIEGEIVIHLSYLHYDINYADFRFDCELVDQSGKRSNIVSSGILHP